jgi:hypothetical protein
MPEFLLQNFFGLKYDSIVILNVVVLILFAIPTVLYIFAVAKLSLEIISDPKNSSRRSVNFSGYVIGLAALTVIVGLLSFLLVSNISQSNLQKESLANETITTHYEISKVGNKLVFERKDKANYLVKSESADIAEEKENQYLILVNNKTYKINKKDVK